MEYGTGCLVCGNDLMYSETTATQTCYYCGVTNETNASCRMGHYVCDACHNGSANDLIERYCSRTDSTSPVQMALTLMNNPAVKMHGPEHHFLVPAVLLAAFHAATNAGKGTLAKWVREARKRADDVKGGFCGFHGACGAAIGAGIFMSIVTGATPLSHNERNLSNLITAECLLAIVKNGGARCCKRETFRAIVTAVEFVRRELGVSLSVDPVPPCVFTAMNRECLRERCGFYRDEREVEIITPTQGAEIQCP